MPKLSIMLNLIERIESNRSSPTTGGRGRVVNLIERIESNTGLACIALLAAYESHREN